MAKYKLTANEFVLRVADNALIPNDPDNRDRVQYDAWLADGNTPDPYVPPPPPVPTIISDRQFFQQLAIEERITNQEALDAVKTGDIPAALQSFIDALPTNEKFDAEMLLSGAVEFRRDHPLTIAIGEAQDMTSEQIDDFFRAAAAL
jgi:hypothetical protein